MTGVIAEGDLLHPASLDFNQCQPRVGSSNVTFKMFSCIAFIILDLLKFTICSPEIAYDYNMYP